MKLEVIDVIENEDGSAEVRLDLDQEGMKLLLQRAFNNILWEMIEKEQANESRS